MEGLDRRAIDEKRRGVDPLMATVTKHYIRRYVWLPVARARVDRLGHPIDYFTLTTPDLFDVRLLHQAGLLQRTERGYPGLGFCEFNDKTFDEIIRRVRWCGWSYKGWFEDMVRNHPSFQDDFAFDVINLDFILVPFPDRESPLEGTWGAILRVLEVQRHHRRSFDLFLTFRGSQANTDLGALNRVAELLQTNIQAGRGVAELEARIGHRQAHRVLGEDYVEFLCMGVPKLLIGDALNLGFELTRYEVYKYPRTGEEESYDIVKFVFSFEVSPALQRQFADPPRLVANYDAAVPLIFSTQVNDVANILEGNAPLVNELEADLASMQGGS